MSHHPRLPRLLLVCPTFRDERELALLGAGRDFSLARYDYASLALEDITAEKPLGLGSVPDPLPALAELRRLASEGPVDGALSTDDYPGATLAAVLADEKGLPGVKPRANLLCQHKYEARLAQRALAPDAVPDFRRLDPGSSPAPPFPFFVKPIKSFFSVGASRVEGPEAWPPALRRAALPKEFFAPFAALLERYADFALGEERVLAEELLKGDQVTVEGFVRAGRPVVLGVVDSIMYPGTRSFQRFEYPSSLPAEVLEGMAGLAASLMSGLGYGDGLFNIEMMREPESGRVRVIEINPRMSSQFADLFEKVDGTNSYSIAVDLALGREPRPGRRRGRHAMAASCVLRTFADKKAVRLPSEAEIARLQEEIPDARVEVLAETGSLLSQQMQDGESYRYGILNLGGAGRDEIQAKLELCLKRLPFVLERPDCRPGQSAGT